MCTTKTVDLRKEHFGSIDGKPIYLYMLRAGFITLRLINYGTTITAIEMQDRNMQMNNIVAGFTTLEEYLNPHPYMGAVIGRFANRIAMGRFKLDGNNYQLSVNDFPNHLHGGVNGFHRKIWQPEVTQQFPDAPNHPSFPNSILRAGDNFSSRTIYKFSLICG
jgi:aldose 1-epimerase